MHAPAIQGRFLLLSCAAALAWPAASAADAAAPAGGAAPDRHATLDAVIVRERPGGAEYDDGPNGRLPRQAASATKTRTPLLETPQSVSVLTQADLQASGAVTLGQALAYSPGLHAMPGGGNDSSRYDFFSLRGQTYNGALFLDGMRASFGVGNLSLPQFDPWLLERVEVLRGPGSMLYGQSLPGGLVNALSKRPQAKAHRQASVTLGNWQRRELRLDAGGAAGDGSGRFTWRLAALGRAQNNQIDHVSSRRLALAPSLRWQIGPQTALTLLASYQRDPRGGYYGGLPAQGVLSPLPDGGYVPRRFFVGDPAFSHFSRTQTTLGYDFEHALGAGWTLRHALRRIASQAAVQGLAAAALVPPDTLARTALHAGSRTQALMADTAIEGQARTGSVAHRLLLGLDHMQSRLTQQMGFSFAGVPPIRIRNPVYGLAVAAPASPATAHLWAETLDHARQTGFYVQDQMRHGPLALTLGGRYDTARTRSQRASQLMGRAASAAIGQQDDAFTGRAALSWHITPQWVAYASHATSFLLQAGLMADGQGYRPLRARQWEAGLKYASEDGRLQLAAAAFSIQQKNALTPDADPTHMCMSATGPGPCMTQSGRQRTRGLELEGRAALAQATHIHASLTWLAPQITASNGADLGKRPVNMPRATAALWAERAFTPRLRLGLGVRHTGSAWADAANTLRVPGHTLLDAAAHYAISPHLTLSVRAANLANRRFAACSSASYCNWGQARAISAELDYPW